MCLYASLSVSTCACGCCQKPEEDIESTGAVGTSGELPTNGGQTWILQKTTKHTAEPSLQPWFQRFQDSFLN